jgi:hypothetical protein
VNWVALVKIGWHCNKLQVVLLLLNRAIFQT